MRASTNRISSVRLAAGFQPASWRTCSSVTFLPSQLRSTDSSTMRIDTGSLEIFRPSAFSSAGSEYSLPCLKPWSVLCRLCGICVPVSDHEQIDELVYRGALEARAVEAQIEDRAALPLGQTAPEVGPELLDQDRHAFVAAAPVPDGVFAEDFLQLAAIFESHAERIGDRALLGIVVVAREALVLDAHDVLAQRVDARIGRDAVLVVGRGQPAENERHGDHVLDAVIAV